MKQMHYSIQANKYTSPSLVITGRKKTLKHSFVYLTSGLILCRLGKLEYAIEPTQAFWLPFDCLSAWTVFPDTQYYKVEISARVSTSLPDESGYVKADEWLKSLLEKITMIKPAETIYQHYSYVLLDTLRDITPKLVSTTLSKRISTWTPDSSVFANDGRTNDILLAREIKKSILSGKKESEIIHSLFHDSEKNYHKIHNSYLDKPDNT
ncbi:hypothetical protein [Vibrio salinus]|uniref:hypothetical protein n=1 Tax=Vibrio salinus TaxID=2899784 RepID=UPI001E503E77|nr:hypothetical protein [Vibrio salinus]MCE0495331.1 hypothetical protein [Vibrio salinus]